MTIVSGPGESAATIVLGGVPACKILTSSFAVGEHVLRATVAGALSEADSNAALQAAFPAWFGRPGGADNTCHQRLSRARRDVQALLQAVVRRHELLP
jgi:hypothetical protein